MMDFKKVPLGKKEYRHDERTLMMARFFLPEILVPAKWDFDKDRAPFPLETWGNDKWGNCVIAAEANHLLRNERVEQRRTIALNEGNVIWRYRQLSGSDHYGDAKDIGLYPIDAFRQWRNVGWQLGTRNYSIAAYGELDPSNHKQMRMAAYVLHGIHMGLWLPLAAQEMPGLWDYQGQTGPAWKPGSWGGHMVFAKAFDANSFEILTWGAKVRVTNSFIERYCDEAWAVVDNLDAWRVKQTVDVTKLTNTLSQISSKVNR